MRTCQQALSTPKVPPRLVICEAPKGARKSHAATASYHAVLHEKNLGLSCFWCAPAQCVVLSEGYSLYFGAPQRALDWFSGSLGYSYSYQRDGAISDWLMDLVSVGFQKPVSFQGRCAALLYRPP